MTLIIFIKCADAVIIALDRKESNTSDVGQITKKYYLPTNHEFILALAGESVRIDTIVSDLHIDQSVTAKTINKKLYEIIEKSPQIGNVESMSSGLLLIKDGDSFQFNNVWFTNSQKSIVVEDPHFKCYGEGTVLADFLIRKFNFSSFSSDVACQYLIAIFQDVAKRVDSVGSIENYGLDLIVIKNNGELNQSTIHDSGGIEGIKCNFEPKINYQIPFSSSVFSENKVTEKIETIKKEVTKSIKSHNQTYSLKYQINGGEIISIKPDEHTYSLKIILNAIYDGELTITLPRSLIDAKTNNHDDVFFVTLDGEEIEILETPTQEDRTITVSFAKGCEEIEIIGTELFGKQIQTTALSEPKKEFDVEKLHKLAMSRDASIIVQTDKSVYTYGYDMIVTVINPYFVSGEPIILEIKNEDENIIYKNTIPVSESAKGIYQEIVRVEGKDWSKPGSKYKIKAKYLNKEAELDVFTSDFGIVIELDQKVYSWRDKVHIFVVAPELVKDPQSVEEIGNTKDAIITISTSKGHLREYKLVETGKDTGIFEGEIRLTGFPNYDKSLDIHGISILGEVFGTGPTDGRIPCLNKDGITVSLMTPTKTISASALIRWNVGEISWLESSLPVSGDGIVRVVDPDMNLDPEKVETFEIRVWSDTDPAGIKLHVIETEKNSGIFKGIVKFTTDKLSKSPFLRVAEGDTITAEYKDTTLPEPYSTKDELTITATTMIGTLSSSKELDMVTDKITNEKTKKVVEDKELFQERFPLKPKVSVPKGSSVPGCEKDHRCYIPYEIIIRVNQTVIWNNDDTAAHTVTSGTPDNGPDGEFDSSLFMSGASFVHKFTKKGVYHYFCLVHPWQEGVVVVE